MFITCIFENIKISGKLIRLNLELEQRVIFCAMGEIFHVSLICSYQQHKWQTVKFLLQLIAFLS